MVIIKIYLKIIFYFKGAGKPICLKNGHINVILLILERKKKNQLFFKKI